MSDEPFDVPVSPLANIEEGQAIVYRDVGGHEIEAEDILFIGTMKEAFETYAELSDGTEQYLAVGMNAKNFSEFQEWMEQRGSRPTNRLLN